MQTQFLRRGLFAAVSATIALVGLSLITTTSVAADDPNAVPSVPTYTSPANLSTGFSLTGALTWDASTDSENDDITYDVYLGTTQLNMVLVSAAQTATTFSPTVVGNTTYYWKVRANDAYGSSAFGPNWRFKTNIAPTTPNLSSPANASTSRPLNSVMSWNASIDNDGDAVVYDVYMGPTAGTMTVVSADQTGLTYSPTLVDNTFYYWKVVAKDGNFNISSPTWYFSTNRPPAVSVYSTPANGAISMPLDTRIVWVSATDPDYNYPMTYDVYFGTDPLALSLVSAAQTGTTYYPTQVHSTTYYWQIIARDSLGATSTGPVWSYSTYQHISVPTNLATGKTVTSSNITGSATSINDGLKFSAGTYSTTSPTIQLNNSSSYVTIDLGAATTINSIMLQADGNDVYKIEVSSNNSTWTTYGNAANMNLFGLQDRTITSTVTGKRYVRVKLSSGFSGYYLSEIVIN